MLSISALSCGSKGQICLRSFLDFLYRYGNDEAIISAHSHGSLRGGNAMRDFEERSIYSISKKQISI
ncbi:hypothetical protein [Bartonella krasnovii]|uniref:Putative filamentous hemagglutinin n=1 Tax=Bartonella krasnovii TaxID=2267275 RepID=A0A5B9D0U7_9HYPH|nr:hypothetical protein [Bartonella krasnovii]QEE11664.1 putative filamentous hemagglutinin [Bartonella krasnovii]UNF39192.1 hypothetical protein MNL10_01710 [Bartonella krasnovii]UNF42482.1 hypothetical protein MNL08_01150 [Bartonella krasnovii]UNF44207.1 hypothetical protein MNL07_01535 [Bartonella krasnovii]UNF47381.1 hypothetical protein MNL05_01490 [Bartonella krasnovii]